MLENQEEKEWYSLEQSLQIINRSKQFGYSLTIEDVLKLIFKRVLIPAIKIEYIEQKINIFKASYYLDDCPIQGLKSLGAKLFRPFLNEKNAPNWIGKGVLEEKNASCFYKLKQNGNIIEIEHFQGYLYVINALNTESEFINYAKIENTGICIDLNKADFVFSFDGMITKEGGLFSLINSTNLDFKIRLNLDAFYLSEEQINLFLNREYKPKYYLEQTLNKTAAKKAFLPAMLEYAITLIEKDYTLSYAKIYQQTKAHFKDTLYLSEAQIYSQKQFTAFLKKELSIK